MFLFIHGMHDLFFFNLLIASHRRFFGESLVPSYIDDPVAACRWLYEEAPFAVLAHNNDADPTFVYGNLAAQRRFGYTWEELTNLRSRYSAELPDRDERQALLDRVARDGHAKNYRGVRIAKSGERFMIEDAALWQLIDADGKIHGLTVKILKTTDCP